MAQQFYFLPLSTERSQVRILAIRINFWVVVQWLERLKRNKRFRENGSAILTLPVHGGNPGSTPGNPIIITGIAAHGERYSV